MKILYLNGADMEGGAAKAATRLLQGVHALGADARLHVQRKHGADPLIDGPKSLAGKVFGFARPTMEQLLFGMRPGTMNGPFCAASLPDGLRGLVSRTAPDIVHLHWVARMMRLETLGHIRVPMVWTMHDSWAFTGGCYLPGDCTRYRESCGACPVLGSDRENDLSRRIWERKRSAWHDLKLTIIAPSRWMAACARGSSLFCDTPVRVIPNGLDVRTYRPFETRTGRERFSLPPDRRLILFGAKSATQDRNKGYHVLMEALRMVAAGPQRETFDLVIFGSPKPAQRPDAGFRIHYLGWQDDDIALAQLYAAADVFVFPSFQESLGYAAMEAMSCGTPCVAFDQGGVPDLIDHEQNGYLARPFEAADLARGIAWVLEDTGRGEALSRNARRKVETDFAIEIVAQRHADLYTDILGAQG
ncbi:MAG TPA: glycosyltransferase family 4 protein [Desulfuromonadaceae bacterium]